MAKTTDWRDPARPLDERVEALLATMTVDEKLAQLGSFWYHPDVEEATEGEVAPMQHAMRAGAQALDEASANDGELQVSLCGTNTGHRQGDDIVQLYLTDEVAQVTRPVRELAGYARVALEAGETRRVTFRLHADRASFTGRAGERIVEPGAFTVAVGHSSRDLPLTRRFRITGEVWTIEGERVMTTGVEITEN